MAPAEGKARLRRLADRSGAAFESGKRGLGRALDAALAYLGRCLRIDTRTLAVFRVFAGVLILADLLARSRNFGRFYTDDGLVPQELAMQVGSGSPPFSFYHLTSDPTLIAGLFVVQGLIAVALIVGFRTRIAMALSFLFVISLDQHNPLVLSYADTLFRLLLFWAIFLPLGERWSVDAVQRDRSPRPFVANLFTVLILAQMIVMYVVNGYHKLQSDYWTPMWVPDWEGGFQLASHWPGGEATPLIMGLDEMTFLLGNSMRAFPELLQLGSLLWVSMMLGAWLLIVLRGRLRMFLVALYMGGHGLFAVTVRIGAFPYVAILGLLNFLQGQFWRDAAAVIRVVVPADRPVERLNGRLATHGVRVAGWFPEPLIQSPSGRQFRDAVYGASSGLVSVAVVFLLVFSAMIGGVEQGYIATADDLEEGQLGHPVVHEVAERVGSDLRQSSVAVATEIRSVQNSLRIRQPDWTVFAPTPRTTDRYYVFPAVTADGEKLDVYNERNLTFERPGKDLQTQHDTYRERFYMNSIRRGTANTQELLAEHLCETWPEEHGQELTHINFHVVEEDVTMETIDDPSERDRWKRLVYQHGCGDHEPRTITVPGE